MAAMIQKRLRAYQSGLLNIVAFLSEARIRQLAGEQVDFFVEGPEGSTNDAAIFVGSETLPTASGPATTWFVGLPPHRRKKTLAALDIKSFAAKCDNKRGTFFSIHIQPGQRRSCQALIVVSPKEPDFVVLIPMHYLPATTQSDIIDSLGMRPLWTLHPLPAFPPEYTAFVTPVAQLGLRLENMRAYYNKSSDTWGNEYTGVNFTEVPPPQLSDRSVLEPTAQPVANALGRLQRYFTAFQNCSERFRVDLVGVRPFGGDFKIIEISTQQEVFVELKDGIVEVVTDEESGSLVLRHPLANPAGPDGRRPIFTWKAQWDYLLSADLAQGHAYVFPRDKVPAGWWDRHGIGEMWEGFQAYKINLGRDRCMVRGIEEVLDRTRAENGSMRARNVRPVRPSPDEAWKETEHHLGSGDAGPVARHGWSTSGLRRGFGSAAHEELRGDTYPQWASEVLIELCRASGEGVVLDFGAQNTKCRYAIARYRWSDIDKVRYDRDGEPPARVWNFPKNTPVVPLTFAGSSWTGDWQPYPNRNFTARGGELAGRPGSLVILDLYPERCLRMRHDRFVFASEHVKPTLTRGVRGLLREGLVDRFAVCSGDLITVMTAPLRGELEVTLGVPGSTIRATDYCHLIRELHQAGVDAPWKHGRER